MKQHESIEWELRLAKEYWLRTVQPHIAGRKLRGVELFVANHAHSNLQVAKKNADDWNRSYPFTMVGALVLVDVDLSAENFREPEELFADENLKPEMLAEIAASLMNKNKVEITPAEAIRTAHELLMAAERYIGALPKQKQGTESLATEIGFTFSPVTFAEILRSNEKDSGQTPLLPPVQQGRNEGRLTLTALKAAVTRFWQEHPNREEEYDCEQWQDEVDIFAPEQAPEGGQISLQDLCTLRWERFKNYWQHQQSRAQKRKPPQSKRPKKSETKANLPQSAASSPTTAGKREQ